MPSLTVFTPASRCRMRFAVCALLLAAVFGAPAHAQKKAADVPINLVTGTDQCKNDVLKFAESMAFVRQSLGNEAAEDLKKRLMPPELESKVLATEGYCGLSRYIREKKLNR